MAIFAGHLARRITIRPPRGARRDAWQKRDSTWSGRKERGDCV